MSKGAYIGVEGIARKVKKGYIGVPSEYRVLEYIESSGTQYIDTGITIPDLTSVYRFEMDITVDGASGQSVASAQNVGYMGINGSTMLTATKAYGLGTSNAGVPIVKDHKYHIAMIRDTESRAYIIDGTTITTSKQATAYADRPLGIFKLSPFDGGFYSIFGKLYSFSAWKDGELIQELIPCYREADGKVGAYDTVTGRFYEDAAGGSFIAGAETGKVISVARKIKKTYIGIGGVARPCWSGGELVYYGTVTPLNATAWLLAAAKAGEKLLFAGGSARINSSFRDDVTAYDASLTAASAPFLSGTRQELSGAWLDSLAFFAGGNQNTYYRDTVDIYDESLTKSTKYLNVARGRMAAARVGGHVLFAGGYAAASKNAVDAFDASLTRTNPTLSEARYGAAGASIGQYALVAGGSNYNPSVETFNESLTRSWAEDLSVGRYHFSGVTHADHALFVGGWGDSGAVDAYDASLTHTVLPTVAVKSYSTGTVLGDYALFHGGRDSDWGMHADVAVYDASLTCTMGPALSAPRWGDAAGTVGNYALFAGGGDSSAAGVTVDAYTID